MKDNYWKGLLFGWLLCFFTVAAPLGYLLYRNMSYGLEALTRFNDHLIFIERNQRTFGKRNIR